MKRPTNQVNNIFRVSPYKATLVASKGKRQTRAAQHEIFSSFAERKYIQVVEDSYDSSISQPGESNKDGKKQH